MKVLNLSQDAMNFRCISCGRHYSVDEQHLLCKCGGLLEVIHNWENLNVKKELEKFKDSNSGVWRFKPLVHQSISDKHLIMRGEGRTGLYHSTQTRRRKPNWLI